MIKRAWQVILILFIVATFGGCSLPRVTLDQSSASRIKTIGMPEIKQPTTTGISCEPNAGILPITNTQLRLVAGNMQ